jgi:hypothetical protein
MVLLKINKKIVLEHIEIQNKGIESTKRLLNSAKKKFWKKNDVKRLIPILYREYIPLGINQFVLEDYPNTIKSFSNSFELILEMLNLGKISDPSYSDIEVIAASSLLGRDEKLVALANKLFNEFDFDMKLSKNVGNNSEEEEFLQARHGIAALLGWIAKRSISEIESHSLMSDKTSSHFKQFKLWGQCAIAAKKKDLNTLNSSIEELAEYVKHEMRYGDFKLSHEQYVYLPAMLILYLAKRDGLEIKLPTIPQFPEEILNLKNLVPRQE